MKPLSIGSHLNTVRAKTNTIERQSVMRLMSEHSVCNVCLQTHYSNQSRTKRIIHDKKKNNRTIKMTDYKISKILRTEFLTCLNIRILTAVMEI